MPSAPAVQLRQIASQAAFLRCCCGIILLYQSSREGRRPEYAHRVVKYIRRNEVLNETEVFVDGRKGSQSDNPVGREPLVRPPPVRDERHLLIGMVF